MVLKKKKKKKKFPPIIFYYLKLNWIKLQFKAQNKILWMCKKWQEYVISLYSCVIHVGGRNR